MSNHAMAIYGFDAASGDFEIYNPWGTGTAQSWDTTFRSRIGPAACGRRRYFLVAANTAAAGGLAAPGASFGRPTGGVVSAPSLLGLVGAG